MELQSLAFFVGSTIPFKYTCDDTNISPPLSWDSPPEGTVSFVLLMEDPDAPKQTFTHWVVYDLPANLRHLPEGITQESHLPGGGVQGVNDFGQLGFGGPCPPSGTHRYFFKLYALDQLLGLPPGARKAEVLAAMKGHVLEAVELMGRYARQSSVNVG
ncbi:YbhB/YbcL family Raf kinase inhibitor-like protein [Nostoc sp. CCY0012]|uniref:YbhB/YbcL family Raf kinase inhibitor-like protein n=1 Tax=Nostoc sp. CCY0012 TaxID=1056123 RepID=UPI0039C6200A